ncbi:GNAT family N-acetyltransferase [Aquimarina addita]|uniref:GNAT family N-acetyltransferase n=1 Tax=Aquimarina addita TaxID=870485 RepID=A0ABP7XBA8_9FLAO
MNFLPKTYTIKNDQTILIREATPNDAFTLLQLKQEYLKKTKTLPLFDYEYPNNTDQEKEMIKKYQLEKNSIILVAVSEDTMIGNIDLTGSRRKKTAHTAMIGMGIHTEWQNQGIGTLLLQNVLDWAKENEILKTIWLEVYNTNSLGIALYQKMGFESQGLIPDFFFENNSYIDKIIMSRAV